jgi:phosphoglucomutase
MADHQMNLDQRFELWKKKADELGDEVLIKGLSNMEYDEIVKNECFISDISFGTAGLRGVRRPGPASMNAYTVGRAARGVAACILAHTKETPNSSEEISQVQSGNKVHNISSGKQIKKTPSVVIAFDCRYHSKDFAFISARIFAETGIKVYIFKDITATPELSFTIRDLGASGGVNLTASHNPKEYNGFKVYWNDGAQISGAVSDQISAMIEKMDLFSFNDDQVLSQSAPVKVRDGSGNEGNSDAAGNEGKSDAAGNEGNSDAAGHVWYRCGSSLDENDPDIKKLIDKGSIVLLSGEADKRYTDYVLSQSLITDLGKKAAEDLPLVYTPLNGAGLRPMKTVMASLGFKNFNVVEEQSEPDPEFSTVGYPNPEDPKAFAYSEKLADRLGADIIAATDPDSDRMAIEIRGKDGRFIPLNGNQTGALMICYKAKRLKELGQLKDDSYMVKSIVTGDLGKAICDSYGIKTYEALTGFKNICGRIPELDSKGMHYFFGYEESIGCAPEKKVRDKDGVAAAMLIFEMAADYAAEGKTLSDALDEIYEKYGFYRENFVSLILKGEEGKAEISSMMDKFRSREFITSLQMDTAAADSNNASLSHDIGSSGHKGDLKDPVLVKYIDYADGYGDIPASNVLRYYFSASETASCWCAVRPSGTEPKLKFYFYAVSNKAPEEAEYLIRSMKRAFGQDKHI